MTIIDSIIEDKRVWTTLITNTKYLTGLLALDYTLKKVGSKYPLVALYTDTLSEEGHKALDARDIPKLKINIYYLSGIKTIQMIQGFTIVGQNYNLSHYINLKKWYNWILI